jgi:methyltransferase (TIGR00027 family)
VYRRRQLVTQAKQLVLMKGLDVARTDDDSWDLASSVGATATMVAAARAIATNVDDHLIDDPFAEPLVRAVGVDFFTRWASGELDLVAVDDREAGWGLDLMTDMMAARTRYFDEFFHDAARAGIRQGVILASGLDARGYRLHWADGTKVFEIDQPQVIEFKTATLAGLGALPTTDLRFVPIDLRRDWPTALRKAGFDTDQPTAWIAEGLLAFLPSTAQDLLLDELTELSAPGSRVATETFGSTSRGDAAKTEATMAAFAQQWREHGLDIDISELWYHDERNDVAEYLDARGWTSVGTTMRELLAKNGLPPAPEQEDGISVADNVYYTSMR